LEEASTAANEKYEAAKVKAEQTKEKVNTFYKDSAEVATSYSEFLKKRATEYSETFAEYVEAAKEKTGEQYDATRKTLEEYSKQATEAYETTVKNLEVTQHKAEEFAKETLDLAKKKNAEIQNETTSIGSTTTQQ